MGAGNFIKGSAMSQKGMEGALSITKAVEILKKSGVSGYCYVAPRKGKQSNPSVIENLAKGGRDVRPGEKDVFRAANIFIEHFTLFLKKLAGRTAANGQTVTVSNARQQGAVSAMKKALLKMLSDMQARIKGQKTNDGSKALAVTKPYAAARKAKRGVNESVVYVDTGEMSNSVFGGKIKINVKKSGKLSAIKDRFQ